jgi:hypothetical protein
MSKRGSQYPRMRRLGWRGAAADEHAGQRVDARGDVLAVVSLWSEVVPAPADRVPGHPE